MNASNISIAIPWYLTKAKLAASAAALTLTFANAQAAPMDARPLLHPLFSENAVLQRDRALPIWGWTQPNAKVQVEFDGNTQTLRADNDGRWTITLAPHAAGGPHTLNVTATANGESEARRNLLFGDVWLCGGQSNMAYDLRGVNNYKAEIAAANYPNIRLLNVSDAIKVSPISSFKDATWQLCTPQTATLFSGVGYFFGRKLNTELKVPIGLINSSWSGTPGESWVSAPALAALPEFTPTVNALKAEGDGEEAYQSQVNDWWLKCDPGSAAHQEAAAFDDTAWLTMSLPGAWESKGFAAFDGVMWFRRSIDVPEKWVGRNLKLDLGTIDDNDTTYWNGEPVGSSAGFSKSRSYSIPGAQVKKGRAVIAVRVLDINGGGGMTGPSLSLNSGADTVSLNGEWKVKPGPAYQSLPPAPKYQKNPNAPTVLFNGKIAPLLPGQIKGVIWYQGESNADNAAEAEQYRKLLPILINDWRAHLGEKLPFYIMQLANFKAPDEEPRDDPWPNLREAQLQTSQHLPNTYLTVITDLGEEKDVHFHNKQEAGARLALTALGNTYGFKIECSGPTLRDSKAVNGTMILAFDHAHGLRLKGDENRVFALAGADQKFHWATPQISGNQVTLRSPEVPAPVYARFGWSNNPRASLYNSTGLPASPFRVPAAKE